MAYRFDEFDPVVRPVAVEADAEMLALIRRATAAPPEPPVRRVGGTGPKHAWRTLRQVTRDLEAPAPAVRRGPQIQRLWPLFAGAALIVLLPLQVLALAALYMVLLCTLLVWVLGYDRISRMTVAQYHAIQASDPRRAEELRHRAIRICDRLDTWLGSLPDNWTRGLYLPDFDPDEAPEIFASDPFERLQQIAAAR